MSTIALTPTTPRLRLTRRGRVVFGTLIAAPLALVLALSAFAGSAFAGSPAQAGSTASSASFEYVTVASGESLWDLAVWISPESDPREVVSALVSLNQLQSSDVQPGQRLAVPAAYSS